MNLADMLCYADIHQLSTIANQYGCQCSTNSKNELIQSILSQINRKEVSEKLIQSSTLEDLRFLYSLLFDQRNSYSLEELIARVELSRFVKEEDKSSNPREVISKFKQRGWLFNGFSYHNKYLLQVPQDLKQRFSDILAKQFSASIVTMNEPMIYRDEQMLIREDIYHFLHFLYHQEVLLTAEGFMYKRSVQQILERFSVKEDLSQKEVWRFGYGRRFKEYPNRLSFIYDYCYYNDFVMEQNQKLLLTEKANSFVVEGMKADLTDIYRFWIKLYKGPVKHLQSFVSWIDQFSKSWVTVESLKQTLCIFIKPFYYDHPETILEQRIIQMMMHLGLLRIGEDETGGKLVQVTKLGSKIINGVNVNDDDIIEVT